jgi:2-C-methyl-D-erythritol 4-phosphate cytidylyltransferase
VSQVTTAVVVAAAGRGRRLGPGPAKALRELAGEPLLVHAVRSLVAAPSVNLVVVAAPADQVGAVRAMLADVMPERVALAVVAGGHSRTASVRLGLAVLPDEVDVVLVHDAARALVPAALVEAVVAAVRDGAGAVVPGLGVADTIKSVDEAGVVTATVDRSRLRSIQTPQGFSRVVLMAAHEAAAAAGGEAGEAGEATDDAGLVERIGGRVVAVPGSEEAFKVTTPLDLLLARAVLGMRGDHR